MRKQGLTATFWLGYRSRITVPGPVSPLQTPALNPHWLHWHQLQMSMLKWPWKKQTVIWLENKKWTVGNCPFLKSASMLTFIGWLSDLMIWRWNSPHTLTDLWKLWPMGQWASGSVRGWIGMAAVQQCPTGFGMVLQQVVQTSDPPTSAFLSCFQDRLWALSSLHQPPSWRVWFKGGDTFSACDRWYLFRPQGNI